MEALLSTLREGVESGIDFFKVWIYVSAIGSYTLGMITTTYFLHAPWNLILGIAFLLMGLPTSMCAIVLVENDNSQSKLGKEPQD